MMFPTISGRQNGVFIATLSGHTASNPSKDLPLQIWMERREFVVIES